MATAIHGDTGLAYVGGSAIALVHKWDATFDFAEDDITAMDSGGWQRLMVGLKKVTGSIAVGYATDDTAGQTVLQNNAVAGSAVVLALYPGGTAHSFGGTAFLKFALSASFDSPEEATYDFASNGPWSYT